MAYYGRSGIERMTLVVDVDHTLTKLLECASAWHELEYGVKINVKEVISSSWTSVWGNEDVEKKRNAFYESKQFKTELAAVDGANEVLKTLRKFFSLLAITDRPRFVEKQTREWLDHHFAGVFDKLIFVDEDNSDQLVARKKELFDELKVKIAVGSDAAMLMEAAKDVKHVVVVGSLPWMKAAVELQSGVVQVDNWSVAKEVFDRLIEELDLEPLDKVAVGPRLARYTDDLVTVSTRKPAVFYANIINSKFTVQKQETIRLQASEAAITTAVQVAEILRMQNNSTTTKITTRYSLNRPKERGGYRVPKMELVLQRVAHEG
ncbi:unnamed protein product [Peronospora farinosa]|uniref:DNA/RNA-binding protein Alba-like domain-containing protein n=1 Tax=Peronospora farinosa TaxID=134698 RepID=A0AAV0SUR5_9STRA|nr:unnamed protein product [Peronospora farinosa]CAI5706528.1 unnamed protein product [Peronospora farinosa]